MIKNNFINCLVFILILCSLNFYYITDKYTIKTIKDNEKYLTYLPHSGFNNQRIEMENALMLSFLLNRTLLLPKANIYKPISWKIFDVLNIKLNKQDTSKLYSWDIFFNMSLIKSHIEIIEVEKSNDIYKYVNYKDDILIIKDKYKYDYKIVNKNENQLDNKYNNSINIEDLSRIDKKILHFGSLFGSTRISNKVINKEIQNIIKNTTILYNKELNKITKYIIDKIDNKYFSIHIRIGDSVYKKNKKKTIKKSIELLEKQNITKNDILYISTDAKNIKNDINFNELYKKYPNIYTFYDFNINIKKEFIPFVDILICSKSVIFYYTLKYSTFAKYIYELWRINN